MSNQSKGNNFVTLFGWCVAGVIVVSIIGGLMIIGSPAKARDQKIDSKRLRNMQMTARVISCYADANEELPAIIDPVKNAMKTGQVFNRRNNRCREIEWKTDPITKLDFEYNRLGEESFEVCGVFERKGNENLSEVRPVYNSSRVNVLNTSGLRKNGGRHCYTAKNWSKTTP